MKEWSFRRWITWVTNAITNAHPVGSCYSTNTNTNPSAWLGGTWELIDKQFGYHWITNPFAFNTTNTTDSSSAACLHGNAIEFRMIWKNNVNLSDSTVTIATLDVTKCGLNATQHTQYPVAFNDGCNAIGMMITSWSGTTMTITSNDWVTRATSYPTTKDNCFLSWVMVVQDPSTMIDSFCNEFIWKRTA